MKFLVSTQYLYEMLTRAILEKCELITINPKDEHVHLLCEKTSFIYDITIVSNRKANERVLKFDEELIKEILDLLLDLTDQPILFCVHESDIDKLKINLVSQIILRQWEFSN